MIKYQANFVLQVGLVGYCMERHDLFLVYEYIENGTLAEHLRSSEMNVHVLLKLILR